MPPVAGGLGGLVDEAGNLLGEGGDLLLGGPDESGGIGDQRAQGSPLQGNAGVCGQAVEQVVVGAPHLQGQEASVERRLAQGDWGVDLLVERGDHVTFEVS